MIDLSCDPLTLRPPRRNDASAIAAMANDWEVAKWVSRVPHPYGLADAHEFLDHLAVSQNPNWLILDGTGPVGMIGLDTDLGYWLAPHAWGKGYATIAVRAVCDWHFENRDGAIQADYLHGNAGSARVLAKAGFREIGASTCSSRAAGENLPSIRCILTRADWERRS